MKCRQCEKKQPKYSFQFCTSKCAAEWAVEQTSDKSVGWCEAESAWREVHRAGLRGHVYDANQHGVIVA